MPRSKKSNRTDGRYELRRTIGYDANGNRIQKSFYGISQDDAMQKYLSYLASEERKKAEKKKLAFSSWVDRWLHVYKEPDVKATTFLTTYGRPCKNYIIPYFGETAIQDITQVDIKNFLNGIAPKLSQSYIDKIMICLKGIFESAIDNDIIVKNPCRNISCRSKTEPKQKRTYDRETVEALCSFEHKYSLLVQILLRMGLRCSELCGLRWDDIDLEEGFLYIRQALTTESGQIYIGETKSANSKRKLAMPQDLIQRAREKKSDKRHFSTGGVPPCSRWGCRQTLHQKLFLPGQT